MMTKKQALIKQSKLFAETRKNLDAMAEKVDPKVYLYLGELHGGFSKLLAEIYEPTQKLSDLDV